MTEALNVCTSNKQWSAWHGHRSHYTTLASPYKTFFLLIFQIEFRERNDKQLFVSWRLDSSRHTLCTLSSQTILQGTAWTPLLKGNPAPAEESCSCWFHQFGFKGIFTLLQSCPWAYEKATLLVICSPFYEGHGWDLPKL